MSVGERISTLRKERSISQLQLAQAMDVSRQAVSKWENDQMCPDTLKLIKLAEFLDTDVEYLATGVHTCTFLPTPTVRVIEKVVEKPVERIVEKVKIVREPVEILVEKDVIRKVVRIKYLRNPIEFTLIGIVSFLVGLLIGFML